MSTLRRRFSGFRACWGAGREVWLLDPRDAQYLNTTTTALRQTVDALASEGVLRWAADVEYATPTEALMNHRTKYVEEMQDALAFIKPSFNEEMRGGHTNM